MAALLRGSRCLVGKCLNHVSAVQGNVFAMLSENCMGFFSATVDFHAYFPCSNIRYNAMYWEFSIAVRLKSQACVCH